MLHLFPAGTNTHLAFLAKAYLLCVECFKEEGPSDITAAGTLYCTACIVDSVPLAPKRTQVLGCASLYVSDTTAEIWNVAVAPAHRRKGYCRTLCKGLIEMAKAYFPDHALRIVVHPDNKIKDAYVKMGFSRRVRATPTSIVLQFVPPPPKSKRIQ